MFSKNLTDFWNPVLFDFLGSLKQTSTISCLYLHGNYMCMQQLDEVKPDGSLNEALRQVGIADVILINKIDLVTTEQLAAIRQRIRSREINSGHGLPEALHEP